MIQDSSFKLDSYNYNSCMDNTIKYVSNTGGPILIDDSRRINVNADELTDSIMKMAALGRNRSEETMTKQAKTRRIVNIYIVDPDKAVPMDKALLYSRENLLTEDEDQDLLFNLDVKDIVTKHNSVRVTILDEEKTDKRGSNVYLQEVRPSELTMKIVTLAQF